MTVRALLRWNNADSTSDLNARFNYLAEMGVEWGGSVVPGVGLTVTLDQFVANSHEGLLVISDAVETLTVVAGQVNVVVAYVKYNPGGTPLLPIQQVQVFDSVTYNAHPDKPYMVVLAEVDLPPVAVIVTASNISFLTRHEITPVNRSQFRGTTPWAALPVPASPTNRIGDFYWVPDKKVFYFWTGLIWEPINTGSYNSEVLLNNNQLAYSELVRHADGWGVVGGLLQSDSSKAYASNPKIELGVALPANTLRISPFAAHLNGHYLETRQEDLVLPAPPLLGDRFDIVFLEAWREDVIDPGTVTYPNSAGGSYTLEQASDVAEQLTWNPATTAFDVHEINTRDHFWNNLRFRLSYTSGVSADNLYSWNPAAGASQNIDLNPFTAFTRYWVAASTTSRDTKSYAIPLFMVRRYAGEAVIREFVSGTRYVFPIYPLCDTTNLVKQGFDAIQQASGIHDNTSVGVELNHKPSGFISGSKTTLQTVGAANTLRLYEFTQVPVMRCLDFEDSFNTAHITRDIPLGTPPIGIGAWERKLVYLQMSFTMFEDQSDFTYLRSVSERNFPFIKTVEGSDFDYFAWRRGFITWELKVESLGASAVTDEDDAFAALGWSRFTSWSDGGLWQKSLGGFYTSTDYRINVRDHYFAIPICLVHRRNDAPWNYNTNPNGSGVSRPDGRTDATHIYPDDILADLRHTVDISEEDLRSLLDSDIDKAMKGQLRTRGANRYRGSGALGMVGGSRILQSDGIGTVPGAAALTAPDGLRKIWSDAKEYQPVSAYFRLADAAASLANSFNYVRTGPVGVGGSFGTLTVYAPPGAYLVRHIPGVTYTHDDPAAGTYLDFFGSPCWVSRVEPWDTLAVSSAAAKYVNTTSNLENVITFCPYTAPGTSMASPDFYQPFAVTATDDFGRATEMRGYIDLSASDAGTPDDLWGARYAALSWWVCYDRSLVASADNYHLNYGLTEIPDEVHSVSMFGGPGLAYNIGPPCVSVRVPCAGASFVVTSADINSLMNIAVGTTTLAGVDITTLAFSAASTAVVTSVTLDQATQTTITVTISAPFIGDVELLAFFRNSTFVSSWVEVGRGGKSFQGKFQWNVTDKSLANIPGSHCALALQSSGTWNQVEYAGRRLACMPFIWHRVGVGNDWSLYLYNTAGPTYDLSKADYEYSSILTFPMAPLTAGGSTLFKIIFPVQYPIGAVEDILINYTYTPYQGLSSDGGRVATVGPALTKLKGMLHGTVIEDSDWYATQSGPCSYFSGVHAFSGNPVNRAPVRRSILMPGVLLQEFSYLQGMFPEYNSTWLVKPSASASRYNLEASGVYNDAATLNAAAVLRLPYPVNPSMYVTSGGADYLKGVMDFDLDPCRAGAAAGYLNLAPGYLAANQGNFTGLARHSQFSNGLSPFAAALIKGFSRSYAGMDYNQLALSSGMSVDVDKLRNGGGGANLWAAINAGGGGEQVARTMAGYETPTANGLLEEVRSTIRFPGLSTGSPNYLDEAQEGRFLYSSAGPFVSGLWARYTFIPGLTPVNPRVLITMHPGELLQYAYAAWDPSAYFAAQYVYTNTPAANVYLYGTSVVGENGNLFRSANTPTPSQNATFTSSFAARIDTVKVPVAYGQNNAASPTSFFLAGTDYVSGGRPSLRGVQTGYPTTWTLPMVTFADTLWAASTDLAARGGGRGLYCGNSSYRFATPLLVPGSGTDLPVLLRMINRQVPADLNPPQTYQCMPATPLFNDPVRNYFTGDRGGPLAYVFRGLLIDPTLSTYSGRVVLQIAGGPNGGAMLNNPSVYGYRSAMFNPNDITATAIDAFWPSGRPILTKR